MELLNFGVGRGVGCDVCSVVYICVMLINKVDVFIYFVDCCFGFEILIV